jgi:hypothetical protein
MRHMAHSPPGGHFAPGAQSFVKMRLRWTGPVGSRSMADALLRGYRYEAAIVLISRLERACGRCAQARARTARTEKNLDPQRPTEQPALARSKSLFPTAQRVAS